MAGDRSRAIDATRYRASRQASTTGTHVKKRLAALTVAVGLGVPLIAAPASAAVPIDLYVDNTASASCSDAGAGTQSQPYCTIVAAAAVVTAGQTVHVAGGPYEEPLVINRSGTPEQPITFSGPVPDGSYTTMAAGLTIDGQHDVRVDRLHFGGYPTGALVSVRDSTRITLSRGDVGVGGTGTTGIALTGVTDSSLTEVSVSAVEGAVAGITLDAATARVTVRSSGIWSTSPDATGIDVAGPQNIVLSNSFSDYFADAIRARSGADGNVIANNDVAALAGAGIHNAGATGTAIANNTVRGNCGTGIRVDGTSSGVSVQNNVARDNGLPHPNCEHWTARGVNIGVYDDAVRDTVVDYNTVNQHTGDPSYAWNTPMALAAFRLASRQGVHDSDSASASANIDSANAAAPAWQSVDSAGRPSVDDPGQPNTGAGSISYADRGSSEHVGPPTARLTVTAMASAGRMLVVADASASTVWTPLTITSYIFDFGDGSVVAQSSPIASHRYGTAGTTYPVKVTVKDTINYTGSVTVTTWTYAPRGTATPTARAGTPIRR